MRARASVYLEDGDSVRAHFSPPHELPLRHGEPLQVAASIRVYIGDELDLWGAPEVVLRALCDALARTREAEAAGSQEVITEMGGAA